MRISNAAIWNVVILASIHANIFRADIAIIAVARVVRTFRLAKIIGVANINRAEVIVITAYRCERTLSEFIAGIIRAGIVVIANHRSMRTFRAALIVYKAIIICARVVVYAAGCGEEAIEAGRAKTS